LPVEWKRKWIWDISTDYGLDRLLKYTRRSQRWLKNVVDLVYFGYGDKVYLDCGDVPFRIFSEVLKRIFERGFVVRIETSKLSCDWEGYRESFGEKVSLGLSVHSLSGYKLYRDGLNEADCKNRLLSIKRAYGNDVIILMTVMPVLFGEESIREDTKWLLDNGFVVRWFKGYVNKYMRVRKLGAILDKGDLSNYSNLIVEDDYTDIINRIKDVKEDEVLVTSVGFYPKIKDLCRFEVSLLKENKLFGYKEEDASVGLMVVNDVDWFPDRKYVVPREATMLMGGGRDLMGNFFPENVRFV